MAKNIWRGRPMDEVRQSSVAGAQRRAPAHIERGFREADSRSQRDFLATKRHKNHKNFLYILCLFVANFPPAIDGSIEIVSPFFNSVSSSFLSRILSSFTNTLINRFTVLPSSRTRSPKPLNCESIF